MRCGLVSSILTSRLGCPTCWMLQSYSQVSFTLARQSEGRLDRGSLPEADT